MVFKTEPYLQNPKRPHVRPESAGLAMEVITELFLKVTPSTVTRSCVSRPGGRVIKYSYVRPGLGTVG